MSNVIGFAAARARRDAARESRLEERWYSLLVGELGPAEIAVLETLSDEELETFFRLRKRFVSELAQSLIDNR